jgi:Flp pilus assembly protein TadG
MNTTRLKTNKQAADGKRRGNAAVECALVAPLLVLIILGSIDVGQFVNVAQTVNKASREGARAASKDTITNVSQVKTAVKDYIVNAFPNVSSGNIESALTVTVWDSTGTQLTGDLTAVPSGASVWVKATFDYSAVRWTTGFSGVSGKTLSTTTVMRRE